MMLENNYVEDDIEEVNKFLDNLDILDITSVKPIRDYYFKNLDLEKTLNEFTPSSYFLYKNILLDEIGNDIYYIPTTKEKRNMSYILGNRIYRYKIMDDKLSLEVEEDYRLMKFLIWIMNI